MKKNMTKQLLICELEEKIGSLMNTPKYIEKIKKANKEFIYSVFFDLKEYPGYEYDSFPDLKDSVSKELMAFGEEIEIIANSSANEIYNPREQLKNLDKEHVRYLSNYIQNNDQLIQVISDKMKNSPDTIEKFVAEIPNSIVEVFQTKEKYLNSYIGYIDVLEIKNNRFVKKHTKDTSILEFGEDMILIPLKKVSYEALREVIDKDAEEIYGNN